MTEVVVVGEEEEDGIEEESTAVTLKRGRDKGTRVHKEENPISKL